MSSKFSHLNAMLKWDLGEKSMQGDAHNTRLAEPSELVSQALSAIWLLCCYSKGTSHLLPLPCFPNTAVIWLLDQTRTNKLIWMKNNPTKISWWFSDGCISLISTTLQPHIRQCGDRSVPTSSDHRAFISQAAKETPYALMSPMLQSSTHWKGFSLQQSFLMSCILYEIMDLWVIPSGRGKFLENIWGDDVLWDSLHHCFPMAM